MIKRTVVALISEHQKIRIKAFIASLKLAFSKLFALNPWFASFYFMFFNSAFRREQLSVLKGQLRYDEALSIASSSSALLRRNIHRLEKGLIMRPRKPLFASDYIGETVKHYQDLVSFQSIDPDEFRWATDVLNLYFSVVSDNAVITIARAKFLEIQLQSKPSVTFSIPYQQRECPATNIQYSDLMKLFQRRRSVRWFLPKNVDSALVRQAVNAATLAPSACNRQPFRFDLINDFKGAATIANLAMGTTGFSDNIPCLIAVIGDLSCYPAERDRHVIYIDSALATMQLMLALETLGLSSCPINWPDIEIREKRIAEKLCLQYYERPVMLLAIGYADPSGGVPFSQKKSDRLLVREITNVD
jgi:nitroreductase